MTAAVIDRQTVLVVDDSRDELGLLINALEQAGLTALAATSGEAALAMLDRVTPDAVVLDAVMGGLDGFATCRTLKQEKRFAHLPVLFLTGLTDTAHVLEGLEAGGVDYVTKPVVIEELVARLRVHMANARVAAQVALGARVALDATGRHLLAVDAAGRALWCTPQAALLLAPLCQSEAEALTLPLAVSQRLAQAIADGQAAAPAELPAAGPGQPLSALYLGEVTAGEMLFRLLPATRSEPDQLQQAFALTSREAEVLLWISRGKSNPDISEILGISPRTVDKHSERVFAKLGVENRASATSVAMRVLAGRG